MGKLMKKNKVVMVFFDILVLILSIIGGLAILNNSHYAMELLYQRIGLFEVGLILVMYLIFYKIFSLDKMIWRKISVHETIRIGLANIMAFLSCMVIIIIRNDELIGTRAMIVITGLNVLLQLAVRFVVRYYYDKKERVAVKGKKLQSILIYGAGSAGQMILNEISRNNEYGYKVIGFIDDNPNLKNSIIYSVPVLGSIDDIEKVVKKYAVECVFVAMPSQPLNTQKEIINKLVKIGVDVKTVESAQKLIQNKNLKNSLRKIEISDLLNRPEIVIDDMGIFKQLDGQRILVTGAGGSIGSELVRQVIKYSPESLILLDINENSLYEIQQELKMLMRSGDIPNIDIKAVITSIRDFDALECLFKREKPTIVFHAAAHKHVPLMEYVPKEAIKNNIFGTKNLIDLSDQNNVKLFVNISTDKAVNPTNIMGATKRFNEMMLQSKDANSKTKYVAVRFGNVLGSNGSVVPLFRKQIEQGGPVTVTHPDIIRYFMTIPEAVSLILQATAYANGGEIFVLDMGKPVKILNLAEQVIKLSGFQPYTEIEIKFTGLRPGEKLYEELLMSEEGLKKTDNNLIYIANPIVNDSESIVESLKTLESLLLMEDSEISMNLHRVVPTYSHKEKNNEK
uniref:Polysaccharide biosynthesis protein n=1 Tax=Erysipelothrix rhusiopathiae TaxID=1648 RepID=A0A4V0P1A9_ERYRH|nr:polysaccharide biosynthesis protein [Erysipelothrix rhusiopathiae]